MEIKSNTTSSVPLILKTFFGPTVVVITLRIGR